MIIVGIDPGLTGAIAQLGHNGEFRALEDIPIMQRMVAPRKGGVKNQVNGYAVREILQHMLRDTDKNEAHVVIELPVAFPGQQIQTVASSFLTAGALEGVVQCLNLPHTLVAPRDWKQALKLSDSKEQCRAAALRRWPEAAALLQRVKDHNRAEALLNARYGHERYN